MLYISRSANMLLFQKDNTKKYQFFNGELYVGDATTKVGAGNAIDFAEQTPIEKSMMLMYPTDLAGLTTSRAELCGQGVIDPTDPGKERMFVEAPLLTGTTGAVAAVAGTWYVVVHGTVSYNGISYSAGSLFKADGTVTVTAGDGTFRITFAPDNCACNRKEQFKIKNLQYGDEVTGYHSWDNGGYIPRDGIEDEDISEGIGYIR